MQVDLIENCIPIPLSMVLVVVKEPWKNVLQVVNFMTMQICIYQLPLYLYETKNILLHYITVKNIFTKVKLECLKILMFAVVVVIMILAELKHLKIEGIH